MPENPSDCDALREQGWLHEFIDEGNTLAIRCMLLIRDVEPDAFTLRYLLYRLEGVEPEGLDEIIRTYSRLDLGTEIAIVHELHPMLEPLGFDQGCRAYDEPARALLARTPRQTEVRGCARWGY